MYSQPVSPSLKTVTSIEVGGHVGRAGSEVTIQEVCKEQTREDESVTSDPVKCPVGVELLDRRDVISQDVVTPDLISILQHL